MIAANSRPIRVLHVLHSLAAGGAERIVCDIARNRRDQLHTGVICLDHTGPLAEEAREIGVKIFTTNRCEGLDLRQIKRIAACIRQFHPDVIHAHQYTPYFYTALAATAVGFGRIIFTEHGRHYPDVVGAKRKMINQLLRMRRDRVTAVCDFVADALQNHERIVGRDVTIIPNGVECERYRRYKPAGWLADQLGVDKADPICIQVARLHPVKDHATSIRAMAALKRSGYRAHLALIGEGPLAGQLDKLTAELDIRNRVHMLGARSDVPDLLAGAEVFVLSSVSEAASLSILEAMSAATPVVATNVGGNGEIVRHGVTGLLSPRGDSEAMAANLRILLADGDLRRRMGEAGRRRAETLYSQTNMHRQFMGLYRSLAGRNA